MTQRELAKLHACTTTREYQEIPGVTQRLLTKQLRELEESGLISRTVITKGPLRVEYRPTDEGESLRPLVEALGEWGVCGLIAIRQHDGTPRISDLEGSFTFRTMRYTAR
ncbi:winged helix-turn-helix transcriptional regulator [Acetobacter sacchari]|uniref:Winged helix-turn-helix transcriptional regulator n=2 Tax=Acetobacter sacchari TaxID=2661687 RepID=A0ABS3LYQ0_9PROT|nr:winged helix-turn-helix transcriptional regulator [Acetobacter sacchari]